MRNRVPVLAAALAFAVVISAVALLAGRSGDDDLPRLVYSDSLAPTAGAGFERSSAAASDMALMPYTVEYQLAADLDKPADTAPAYRVNAATIDDAARLARAFGLGAPVEEDGAWVARDAGVNELRVDKLGSWYFGAKRDTAVSSDDAANRDLVSKDGMATETVTANSSIAVGECAPCPPDQICTMECRPPERPAGVPTAPEAEAVARELWQKAGIEVGEAKVQADDGWDSVFVRFTPLVNGHAAMGLDQSVSVGVDKKIQFANGWLLNLDKLGDYPLIDPADAVERFGEAGYMGGREPAPLTGTDTPTQIAPVPDAGSGSGTAPRPADATTSSGGTSASSSGSSTGSAGATDPGVPPTGQSEPDPGAGKPPVVDPQPMPVPEPGPAPEPELRIVKLTAVRLALQFTGESILPVYVFTTEAGDDTPPVPAVPDRYLVMQ